MGEVVEISILSTNKSLYSEMLLFLERYLKNENTVETISVMDNWYYDNAIEIDSIKEAENYMETRIVTIEKNTPYEHIGVTVEKNKKGYIIECWINPCKEIAGKQYNNLVNEITGYIKDKNEVLLCGIGKEISVDYEKEPDVIIKESHNIDRWTVSRQLYNDYGLNDLSINSDIYIERI